MIAWPTSAPVTMRRSQNARDAASSRNSFARSQRHSLREGKEHLLDPRALRRRKTRARAQLVEGPFSGYAPRAQQHETVADALGVAELMDREEERAVLCVLAQHRHDVARLSEIETVEGFVEHEQRVRRQQTDRQHDAAMLALGQLAESRA